MARVLLLNGPNLNLLGSREPGIYGAETLESIEKRAAEVAREVGHELSAFQSNAEHELIERIQRAPADGIGFLIFNPAAFTNPTKANFAFGTVGRNTLRGPDLKVIDLSLAKEFRFGERYGLQLRADFVNAFNHPSFEPPHNDISQGNFGVIDSSLTGNGTTVAPRSGQLSARFSF